VDERSLAQGERTVRVYEDQQQESNCPFSLLGWVFFGSVDHDGEEIAESIRCRRCGSTSRING
jgi:hypothetical protein